MLKLLHPVMVHSGIIHIYIYKLVKHGQTCSNIGYPQTGCLILKNTRHDDHLWMQRPWIWPILISFPFVSTSWFRLSGQWKGHSLVASSDPIFSTSQDVKSKSQTSTGSCCKTNPNPPTALEHWKNNKPRSGHKEQVTRRAESFPVLCIALSGTHQFLALAHRLQHGAW